MIPFDTRKDDVNDETFIRTVDPELGQLSPLGAAKPENVHVLFSDPKCNRIAHRLKTSNEIIRFYRVLTMVYNTQNYRMTRQ
jgi:hypothetical protein